MFKFDVIVTGAGHAGCEAAIAAAKLGAKRCFLTDIDPLAVESAKHNALKNGEAEKIEVVLSDLVSDNVIKADLLLANITAEILVRLAPAAAEHLNKGGTVILSGILEDRVQKVIAAFESVGLSAIKKRQMGEWVALVMRQR